jgi:hypothetical protein
MRLLRLLATCRGVPHPREGQYVVSYDPEYHEPDGGYDGGWLVTTSDRAKATRFTIEEATDLWRSGPTCLCHRLRADGKTNRPLTAFHADIEKEEVEPLTAMGGSLGEPAA